MTIYTIHDKDLLQDLFSMSIKLSYLELVCLYAEADILPSDLVLRWLSSNSKVKR